MLLPGEAVKKLLCQIISCTIPKKSMHFSKEFKDRGVHELCT